MVSTHAFFIFLNFPFITFFSLKNPHEAGFFLNLITGQYHGSFIMVFV